MVDVSAGGRPRGRVAGRADEETSPMAVFRPHRITEHDEVGFFAPRSWQFWRALVVCFCLATIVGHWLEIPYCLLMDRCFGIVSEGYPVWTDPWYHPYWVYGVGAVAMTLFIEPLKERFVMRRRTLVGAVLESFAFAVALSLVLELAIGLLVNQPDATGRYPYWDNSQLPLNVFGQAWLVNDVLIGAVAMAYVWVVFPLVCEGFGRLRPSVANGVFGLIVAGFVACCTASYLQLWLS